MPRRDVVAQVLRGKTLGDKLQLLSKLSRRDLAGIELLTDDAIRHRWANVTPMILKASLRAPDLKKRPA